MRPRPVGSPAACARSRRGRRVPAPAARAVRPHQPRNPHRASVSSARRARREASALWAVGPKAQSDPKRGSETMSATGREARMIEQPGARNAPPRTPRRIPPGLSPAPSLRGLESRSSPSCIPNPRCLPQIFDLEKASRASAGQAARFQRAACLADMRGGFGSLAPARLPYAASRPGALRRRARGKRRNPGGKDRRQPSFFAAR